MPNFISSLFSVQSFYVIFVDNMRKSAAVWNGGGLYSDSNEQDS